MRIMKMHCNFIHCDDVFEILWSTSSIFVISIVHRLLLMYMARTTSLFTKFTSIRDEWLCSSTSNNGSIYILLMVCWWYAILWCDFLYNFLFFFLCFFLLFIKKYRYIYIFCCASRINISLIFIQNWVRSESI